jgi:hypothetical protein
MGRFALMLSATAAVGLSAATIDKKNTSLVGVIRAARHASPSKLHLWRPPGPLGVVV